MLGYTRARPIGPSPRFGAGLHTLWVPERRRTGAAPRLVNIAGGAERMEPLSTTVHPSLHGLPRGIASRVFADGSMAAATTAWNPAVSIGATILWSGQFLSGASGANIFGFQTASGPRLCFYNASPGYGLQVYLNANALLTSSAVSAVECVLIGTTRSATDHEFLLMAFTAGGWQITTVTSSSSAGSTASAASHVTLGSAYPAAAYTSFDAEVSTLVAATWTRGMARQEMVALALNLQGLVTPIGARPMLAPGSNDATASIALALGLAAQADTGAAASSGRRPMVWFN